MLGEVRGVKDRLDSTAATARSAQETATAARVAVDELRAGAARVSAELEVGRADIAEAKDEALGAREQAAAAGSAAHAAREDASRARDEAATAGEAAARAAAEVAGVTDAVAAARSTADDASAVAAALQADVAAATDAASAASSAAAALKADVAPSRTPPPPQ